MARGWYGNVWGACTTAFSLDQTNPHCGVMCLLEGSRNGAHFGDLRGRARQAGQMWLDVLCCRYAAVRSSL